MLEKRKTISSIIFSPKRGGLPRHIIGGHNVYVKVVCYRSYLLYVFLVGNNRFRLYPRCQLLQRSAIKKEVLFLGREGEYGRYCPHHHRADKRIEQMGGMLEYDKDRTPFCHISHFEMDCIHG